MVSSKQRFPGNDQPVCLLLFYLILGKESFMFYLADPFRNDGSFAAQTPLVQVCCPKCAGLLSLPTQLWGHTCAYQIEKQKQVAAPKTTQACWKSSALLMN